MCVVIVLSSLFGVLAAVFPCVSLCLFNLFMEMGSDEEDQIKNGNENKKKKIDTLNNNKKRQMKTPFQLQTLEKVYSGFFLF